MRGVPIAINYLMTAKAVKVCPKDDIAALSFFANLHFLLKVKEMQYFGLSLLPSLFQRRVRKIFENILEFKIF